MMVVALVSACGGKDDAAAPAGSKVANSFVVQGTLLESQTVEMVAGSANLDGGYFTGSNQTSINIRNGSFNVFLVTLGKTVGTFNAAGGAKNTMSLENSDLNPYVSSATSPYSITITEYGAVGGKIKGTFSGTLNRVKESKVQTVTISNGKFEVTRAADL